MIKADSSPGTAYIQLGSDRPFVVTAVLGLVLVGVLAQCSPTRVTIPTAATDPTTMPPSGQPGPLPDLVPIWMKIDLETGQTCGYVSTDLGVRLVVRNSGDADAGAFAVELDGTRQSLTGLAAGASLSLWFPGYGAQRESVAVVDVAAQVQESDESNNRLASRLPIPTLPPTCTPAPAAALTLPGATLPPTSTPAPAATSGATNPPAHPSTASLSPRPSARPTAPRSSPSPGPAAVAVQEGSLTISTYPYADFTQPGSNDAYHISYPVLDRAAYDASNPRPRDVAYRTLVVENEFLRLTFLPELGGRLYEIFYKPTRHRVTYRNPVLKPSPWGPPEQGWWLAAGGIEWCLPVEEHGYEWAVPWTAEVSRDGRAATVTLRDSTAGDRLRAEVAVRLEPGAASFTIRPRLENPTGQALAVKYWSNAMLAPGGRNAPTSRLRFVLPDSVTAVTVHSRGDDELPGYNERMSWPDHEGTDFSRLGNWNRWLGFFEDPAAGDFVGVYDESYDEGVIRVFPSAVARGAKVFAFGWGDPISPDNWTDDRSAYVEIHGGPAPTFDDSVTLAAGGHLQWTETWYPVAGLGGLSYANSAAALNLTADRGQIHVGVAPTRPWSGDVVVAVDGRQLWRSRVSLPAGQAWRQSLPGGMPASGVVSLRLQAADGSITAEYQKTLSW